MHFNEWSEHLDGLKKLYKLWPDIPRRGIPLLFSKFYGNRHPSTGIYVTKIVFEDHLWTHHSVRLPIWNITDTACTLNLHGTKLHSGAFYTDSSFEAVEDIPIPVHRSVHPIYEYELA